MFNWLLSFFRSDSVDGIIADINRKIAQLVRVEGEQLTRSQDLEKEADSLITAARAANAEASRARVISARLEALVKFDVA